MTNETTGTGKPLLRVLKLAAKLHKAGLGASDSIHFIEQVSASVPVESLPSAAAPVEVIISEVSAYVADHYIDRWVLQLGLVEKS